jgi:hypothetical protein
MKRSVCGKKAAEPSLLKDIAEELGCLKQLTVRKWKATKINGKINSMVALLNKVINPNGSVTFRPLVLQKEIKTPKEIREGMRRLATKTRKGIEVAQLQKEIKTPCVLANMNQSYLGFFG